MVALASAALVGCRDVRPLRKRHLALLPADFRRGSLVVSEEGEHWAFVLPTREGERVVTRAGEQEPFPQVYRLWIAPKTGRVAYWVRQGVARAGGVGLMADGTLVSSGFAQPGRMVFSKDGTRWATVNGTPSTGSADTLQRGPVVVLADGRELGRASDASMPAFSPDGKHLAYLVERPDGKVALVVDGVEHEPYKDADNSCTLVAKTSEVGPNLPPQFSVAYLSDGSLLVVAQDRDGWAVFRDRTRLASYPGSRPKARSATQLALGGACAAAAMIVPDSIALAAEAPAAAWWERLPGDAERWRVVVNGQPLDDTVCGGYWDDPTPEISADGKHLAYPCRSADPRFPDRVFVVVDAHRYGPYRDVWSITFSSDAQHLAYDASDGETELPWQLYLDGIPFPRRVHALWRPRISASNTLVAWEALPAFGAKGILGVNERRFTSFDDVLWGPTFSGPDVASWVIRHHKRVTRIDLPVRQGTIPSR